MHPLAHGVNARAVRCSSSLSSPSTDRKRQAWTCIRGTSSPLDMGANGGGGAGSSTNFSIPRPSRTSTSINPNTCIVSYRVSPRPLTSFLTTHNCACNKIFSTRARLTFITPSMIGALVMEITYGMDIKSHEDKFLQSAEHAVKHADRAMIPGAFLVDTFPIRSSGSNLLRSGLC